MLSRRQQPSCSRDAAAERGTATRSAAASRLHGVVIGVCLGIITVNPVRADLDPGLKKPYELHVVLHIAEHRALTPVFQDQVQRELRAHLRLTFGKLAHVTVLRAHPLLAEVRRRGLQQALDGWDELSDVKTHFVLIDFSNGRYELQARQHDGATGLSSPVVRRDATSDPRLVARRAALLVDRDFGLAGTVLPGGNGKVQVALQGGGLGVPLDRWIKRDDVFAVARFTQDGDRPRATRLDWTLLQVAEEPAHGVCRCRFFTRFKENELTEGGPVLGYRCLRLATTTALVHLRMLSDDDKAPVPLPNIQVHISRLDFDAPDAFKRATDNNGFVVTDQPFTNVAFVSIWKGLQLRARFPVEIVDDRTIVCRLHANPEADAQAQLELRKDRWVRRIYDLLLADANRVQYLNDLLRASKREQALAAARDGVKALEEDLKSLRPERQQLLDAKQDVAEGDRGLAELKHHQAKLDHFIARLENVLKEESSEKTRALRTLLERARLLKTQAEFAEAIKLYRQLLQESPDQPNVKAELETLEKDWKVAGPAHQQAREFIYNEWTRTMDTAAFKAALPRAREALTACRKAGDRLTPQKLLQADLVHAAALKKRLEVLRQRESEDNRNETRTIGQLADELNRLHREASALVHGKNAPAQ
jgi:tetratricopeptide (TPR) repeat protein